MQIKCLGGFREVGRNAVLLEGKENLLLDYGLKVETGEPPLSVSKLDNVILCHAHLDHSGAVPSLFRNFKPKLFSTISSFDQAHLLLKDSLKIARMKGFERLYSRHHIEIMNKSENLVTYGQQFETQKSMIDFIDAGHIPGSAMPLIETENKRILYTSDFKLEPTRLLNGADIESVKNVDVLIMESTYASREHPDRKEMEKKLFDIISGTVANDGIALVPVFAVGRAAELIMVLDRFKADFPIYLDGMAREATEIALKYPEFIRDPKALKKAMQDVKQVYDNDMRNKIVKKPCCIVTTSGLMEGGPVIHYMKYLYANPQSSITFTGFCVPKTAARYLLDTGRFVNEELDLKVKMVINHLDFSAHAGRSDLFKMVEKASPEKVICMHGDSCERFAKELKSRGFDAVAPKIGDAISV
jgi:putative mRNA 3-end processing factor